MLSVFHPFLSKPQHFPSPASWSSFPKACVLFSPGLFFSFPLHHSLFTLSSSGSDSSWVFSHSHFLSVYTESSELLNPTVAKGCFLSEGASGLLLPAHPFEDAFDNAGWPPADLDHRTLICPLAEVALISKKANVVFNSTWWIFAGRNFCRY